MVALTCGLVALALLLPGLGDYGLWTNAELPALARSRAAVGAALANLQRAPWFPDLLRTAGYALTEDELGLRLPHAIAAALLTALTAGLARTRGATMPVSLLAGAFVLALPLTQLSGRLAIGNPVGEALGVGVVVLGLGALGSGSTVRRLVLACTGVAALVLCVASSGLLLGATIPLAALAVAKRDRTRHALWAAVLVTAGITLVLALRQEDGYIPLLGAAKDLDILEDPYRRAFTDGLEDLGFQVFPWLPLAAAGALDPGRDRWPALWLVIGLAIALPWTVPYGTVAIPLSAPIALCCAQGLARLVDGERPRIARRLMVLLVLGGMLVMGKDAHRTPSRPGAALIDFQGEHRYPAEELGTDELLRRLNRLAMLAVVLVLVGGPGREGGARDRLWRRVPQRVRPWTRPGVMIAMLLYQATTYGHEIVPHTADGFSPKRTLARWQGWVDAGALPATLGIHRVTDEGLEIYGPAADRRIELATRGDVIQALSAAEPAAVLMRDTDLPAIHQHHRQHGWPLYVLSRAHTSLVLAANVLPDGSEDLNPINRVLFDAPPPLANETLLEFDERVQVIGWELEEPVVRGSTRTIKLGLRVLRSLPGGAQMHARLQKGRASRINANWHELAEDLYPSNYWREGDFILHRYTFETPTLEILPGTHELIVALKRGEKSNYEISIPEGKTGEYGVRIRGSKRSFAVIGRVEVW